MVARTGPCVPPKRGTPQSVTNCPRWGNCGNKSKEMAPESGEVALSGWTSPDGMETMGPQFDTLYQGMCSLSFFASRIAATAR
jgi:hypothetical protein